MVNKWFLAFVTLVLTVSLAGCGKSAVEKATGVSVGKDGSVTVKGEDGQSATISSDDKSGSVTITGSDGSKTTISGDDSGKLPEGFPLAMPPGAKIEGSSSAKSDGKTSFTVSAIIKTEIAALADFFEKEIKAEGIADVSRIESNNDGTVDIALSGQLEKKSVWVTLTKASDNDFVEIGIIWSNQ